MVESEQSSGAISASSPTGDARQRGGHSVVAENVVKRFDNGVTALEDFDLRIKHGEVVSIVGPSGCGKSTFLRIVAGLNPATEGSLKLHGEEVTSPRQDIGMMFQKPTLLPWKTALENVTLPRVLAEGRDSREGEYAHEAVRLLELVGLKGFEHTYPPHLSGGMQQRVALARLLIMGVDVLLLDEPFAAVDELTRERLNLEFLDIHERIGATVILVTHNIAEAAFLADRVIVMTPRPGKIAQTVEVDLPRPRKLEHMRAEGFQDATFAIREILESYDLETIEGAPTVSS